VLVVPFVDQRGEATFADQLRQAVGGGDAVMVKGSFGSKMSPIVKALERRFPDPQLLDPARV